MFQYLLFEFEKFSKKKKNFYLFIFLYIAFLRKIINSKSKIFIFKKKSTDILFKFFGENQAFFNFTWMIEYLCYINDLFIYYYILTNFLKFFITFFIYIIIDCKSIMFKKSFYIQIHYFFYNLMTFDEYIYISIFSPFLNNTFWKLQAVHKWVTS